jgi:hypothetical protein
MSIWLRLLSFALTELEKAVETPQFESLESRLFALIRSRLEPTTPPALPNGTPTVPPVG